MSFPRKKLDHRYIFVLVGLKKHFQTKAPLKYGAATVPVISTQQRELFYPHYITETLLLDPTH